MKLIDERRLDLISIYDMDDVPGGRSSLLGGKRKRKDGGDLGDRPGKRSRLEPGSDGKRFYDAVEFDKDHVPAVIGKFSTGPPLQTVGNISTPLSEQDMENFVKAVLSCKGKTKVAPTALEAGANDEENYQYRPIQIPGANDLWNWFNLIFGDQGRKRLLTLSKEANGDRMTIQAASHHLSDYINGTDVPPEMMYIATAYKRVTEFEWKGHREKSVTSDYKALAYLATFGAKVEDMKKLMRQNPPPEHIKDFLDDLNREFPPSVGHGRTTQLLEWLCKHARFNSQPNTKKMQELLQDAELLYFLMEEFGHGILLFIAAPWGWRFKRIARGTIPEVLQVYSQYWKIKATCTKAWEVIGNPVIEEGKNPTIEIDLKKSEGYSFLGEIGPDGNEDESPPA